MNHQWRSTLKCVIWQEKKQKIVFIYFEHSEDDSSKLTLADISQYYELFQSVLHGSLRNLSSLHDHLLPFQQSGMQQ